MAMGDPVYLEQFTDGPGGWYGWISNAGGPKSLEWQDHQVTSRSPWWIDYNHAPPGAGYMHMVFSLSTTGPQGEVYRDIGGTNRFIAERCPTNFTSASMTIRSRGELLAHDSQLVTLIQGNVEGITSGWLCTGRPIRVTESWSEQTISLDADPGIWTPLGVRHDRGDMYGVKPLERVLSDVNVNIMLVLFPLDVAAMGPLDGDPHLLRPERDYPVWRHRLPDGYITLDEVRIDFAG
jgi:hypothetical protein